MGRQKYTDEQVINILREGYACVILLPLGYPNEQPEARKRKEIPEIVFKNKFGVSQS